MSGFKVCGIYPFDRNALKIPQQQKHMESLAEESGLAYIARQNNKRATTIEVIPLNVAMSPLIDIVGPCPCNLSLPLNHFLVAPFPHPVAVVAPLPNSVAVVAPLPHGIAIGASLPH